MTHSKFFKSVKSVVYRYPRFPKFDPRKPVIFQGFQIDCTDSYLTEVWSKSFE